MFKTINKVILVGRLGSEVKMHYFKDGSSIGNFNLVTEEFITKLNNEKVKLSEWHKIVVKNKVAEYFEQHINKGDLVYVEGRLTYRKWQNEGVERLIAEVYIQDFSLLSQYKS